MDDSTSSLGHTVQQKKMINLIVDLERELDYQKKLQVQMKKEFQEALAKAEQILSQRI